MSGAAGISASDDLLLVSEDLEGRIDLASMTGSPYDDEEAPATSRDGAALCELALEGAGSVLGTLQSVSRSPVVVDVVLDAVDAMQVLAGGAVRSARVVLGGAEWRSGPLGASRVTLMPMLSGRVLVNVAEK